MPATIGRRDRAGRRRSPAGSALAVIDRRASANRCACGLSGRVTGMEHEGLVVSVNRAPTEAVVSLKGAIDMSSVAQMSSAVEHLLVDAPPRVVLDLAGVTFCDSQGLGTLVSLSQKARMVQSVLVLTNVGDFLQRVLDVTGLRPALHIV
jgi:anti-sigma B factor antagonist